MKVRIVRPALADLAAARQFHDRKQEGVGEYFFDSLFSEIDSLGLYGGSIASISVVTDYSRDGFPMLSTMASSAVRQSSIASWIVAEIPS